MSRIIRHALLMILLAVVANVASAQVTVGTPPFISTGGGPEVINLANLNAHYTIPIVHKAGRGLAFVFNLTYDSSIWYPVTACGKTSWAPGSTWGWDASEVDIGGVRAQSTYSTNQYGYTFSYTNWNYIDGFGTSHSFNGYAYEPLPFSVTTETRDFGRLNLISPQFMLVSRTLEPPRCDSERALVLLLLVSQMAARREP